MDLLTKQQQIAEKVSLINHYKQLLKELLVEVSLLKIQCQNIRKKGNFGEQKKKEMKPQEKLKEMESQEKQIESQVKEKEIEIQVKEREIKGKQEKDRELQEKQKKDKELQEILVQLSEENIAKQEESIIISEKDRESEIILCEKNIDRVSRKDIFKIEKLYSLPRSQKPFKIEKQLKRNESSENLLTSTRDQIIETNMDSNENEIPRISSNQKLVKQHYSFIRPKISYQPKQIQWEEFYEIFEKLVKKRKWQQFWNKVEVRREISYPHMIGTIKFLKLFKEDLNDDRSILDLIKPFQYENLLNYRDLKHKIKSRVGNIKSEGKVLKLKCMIKELKQNQPKKEPKPKKNVDRSHFINLRFKNNLQLRYQYDQFIDEMEDTSIFEYTISHHASKNIYEKVYNVNFADLRKYEPSIRALKWSKEKFEILEEFLMNKKWNVKYQLDNKCHLNIYLNPKSICYYMNTLNLEGSFLMYRPTILGRRGVDYNYSVKTELRNFVVYPQIIVANKKGTKGTMTIHIPELLKENNDYQSKIFVTSLINLNPNRPRDRIGGHFQFINLTDSVSSTKSYQKKVQDKNNILRALQNIYYQVLEVLDKRHNIYIEHISERRAIDLTADQIDQVLRTAIINTWMEKLRQNKLIRIAGWRIQKEKQTSDDQLLSRNIEVYNRKVYEQFLKDKDNWIKKYGQDLTETQLNAIAYPLLDHLYNIGNIKMREPGEYGELEYVTRHYHKIPHARNYGYEKGVIIPYLDDHFQTRREGSKNVNKLIFCYLGLDQQDDPNFWQCKNNYTQMGWIFGKFNIVYHDFMSTEYCVKMYIEIVKNYRRSDYNPFDEEHRMPFYDYIVFKQLTLYIQKNVVKKLCKEFKGKPFSNIRIDSQYQESYDEIFDALEDVRSCTFSKQFNIQRTLSGEVDFIKMINSEGFFITPHFHQHFDIKNQHDHECFRMKIMLLGKMLGFRFASHDVTGEIAN